MSDSTTAARNSQNGSREDGAPRPTLSLIIPTYNEAKSIEGLLGALHQVLGPAELTYEVVLVDDNSPDGTAAKAEELAKVYPVRVHRRPGKLGLSSAVIDGWKVARGELLGVMDADLSHDPALLPSLVASILDGGAEIAVGNRYIAGGGMGNWPLYRQLISRTAVILGSVICPVKDVTSGYFIMRRSVIEGVKLNPIGFKIALEVLVRGRYRNFTEVAYVFQDRQVGKSKLGHKEVLNYLIQLGQLIAHWIRLRPRRQRVAPVLRRTVPLRG